MATILEQLSAEIGVENPITADEFRLFVQVQRGNKLQLEREQIIAGIETLTQESAAPRQIRLSELQSEINTLMLELEKLLSVRDTYQMELNDVEEIPSLDSVRTEFQRRLTDALQEKP